MIGNRKVEIIMFGNRKMVGNTEMDLSRQNRWMVGNREIMVVNYSREIVELLYY